MAQNDGGSRSKPPKGGDFIKQFDTDGDGKVSEVEFNGPDGPFAHMDKDGDGFIDENEAPKGPPPGRSHDRQGSQKSGKRGGGFMTRFDKDKDGKVSRGEFDGPDEHFTPLDKNGDGVITEDEAPQGPPPGRGQKGQGGEGRP